MSGESAALQIVPARPEHVPELARIESECFSAPWSAEFIEGFLSREGCIFLIALLGGELAGYISCQTVLDEAYIANVATAPALRRRGVADALISALVQLADSGGMSFLTLEVRQSNAPAVALYEKHGFKSVGTLPNYYEKPREAALLMTRFL